MTSARARKRSERDPISDAGGSRHPGRHCSGSRQSRNGPRKTSPSPDRQRKCCPASCSTPWSGEVAHSGSRRRGRIRVSLRLDPDVVEKFRSTGPGSTGSRQRDPEEGSRAMRAH